MIRHVIPILLLPSVSIAQNTCVHDFERAKELHEDFVYRDHNITLYCKAIFEGKKITQPEGFTTSKYKNREHSLEWEHVVPAQSFGQSFQEWQQGPPECVDSQGEAYAGRDCVEKVNKEFQLMHADMYNLYPAIGSVNAQRSNYRFAMLPNVDSDFGSCPMKIDDRKVQPPEYARGRIDMTETYPKFTLSDNQRKLMRAWDKEFPVSDWECKRAERIEKIQGNKNRFVRRGCD